MVNKGKFIKGNIPWSKGKTGVYSEETIQKMSKSAKNRLPISEETKQKMSEARKGRKHSEATKKKMKESIKNRPAISEETRQKMSETKKGNTNNLGHKHTEETKRKISEAQKGKGLKGGYASRNETPYDQYELLLNRFHEIRRNKEKPDLLEVTCAKCKEWFLPTYIEVRNRINNGIKNNGGSNLYCSEECKNSCPTYSKSYISIIKQDLFNHTGILPDMSRELQPELRKLVLERDNYQCTYCAETTNLHCHHIDPVINNPVESADVDNCMTLCVKHHLEVHQQPGCTYAELRCTAEELI